MALIARCPCGSGLTGAECCDRFLQGPASAPTAVALMRSRFTAYVREDAGYLRRTWHPSTRPRRIGFDEALRWTGLEVIGQTGGSLFDAAGTVEFAAHYVAGGRPGTMRENSRFVREDGQWRYLGADP